MINETIAGFRDLFLHGMEKQHNKKFEKLDRKYKIDRAKVRFFNLYPKYMAECLALILLSLSTLYLSFFNISLNYIIPIAGTLAIAAQRLLPALQQVYFASGTIKSTFPSVDSLFSLIKENQNYNYLFEKREGQFKKSKIRFKSIVIESIAIAPKGKNDPVIKNLSLKLNSPSSYLIKAPSGFGKSTLLDSIAGFLPPKSGEIFIDNNSLYHSNNIKFLSDWHKSIGYVNQDSIIYRTTITENITFRKKIRNSYEKELFYEILSLTSLDEFVNSLEDGLNTIISESGSNLSGGQKQRINIARALFKKPSLLILDEATSGLDRKTASAILRKILLNKERDYLVVSVAHNDFEDDLYDYHLDLTK